MISLTTQQTPYQGQVLTNDKNKRDEAVFEISIREALNSQYSFKSLKSEGLKAFDRFINETVGKSLNWRDVETLYLRTKGQGNKWKEEVVNGEPRLVGHFRMPGISESRIFGYREGNDFIVCKIDVQHKVHRSK